MLPTPVVERMGQHLICFLAESYSRVVSWDCNRGTITNSLSGPPTVCSVPRETRASGEYRAAVGGRQNQLFRSNAITLAECLFSMPKPKNSRWNRCQSGEACALGDEGHQQNQERHHRNRLACPAKHVTPLMMPLWRCVLASQFRMPLRLPEK